jgi:hypothetical protein
MTRLPDRRGRAVACQRPLAAWLPPGQAGQAGQAEQAEQAKQAARTR